MKKVYLDELSLHSFAELAGVDEKEEVEVTFRSSCFYPTRLKALGMHDLVLQYKKAGYKFNFELIGGTNQYGLIVMLAADKASRKFSPYSNIHFSKEVGLMSGSVDEISLSADSAERIEKRSLAIIEDLTDFSLEEIREWISEGKYLYKEDMVAGNVIED